MSFLIAYESCMPPHTPAMMVMRGFTFHPLLCRVLISGSYSVCSSLRAWLGNLSWQYEDFYELDCGYEGRDYWCLDWVGAPIMHRMANLSFPWHWHGVWARVHLSSYSKMLSR